MKKFFTYNRFDKYFRKKYRKENTAPPPMAWQEIENKLSRPIVSEFEGELKGKYNHHSLEPPTELEHQIFSQLNQKKRRRGYLFPLLLLLLTGFIVSYEWGNLTESQNNTNASIGLRDETSPDSLSKETKDGLRVSKSDSMPRENPSILPLEGSEFMPLPEQLDSASGSNRGEHQSSFSKEDSLVHKKTGLSIIEKQDNALVEGDSINNEIAEGNLSTKPEHLRTPLIHPLAYRMNILHHLSLNGVERTQNRLEAIPVLPNAIFEPKGWIKPPSIKAGVQLSVFGGLNYVGHSLRTSDATLNLKKRKDEEHAITSWAIGLGVRKELSSSWAISSGLNLVSLGEQIRYTPISFIGMDSIERYRNSGFWKYDSIWVRGTLVRIDSTYTPTIDTFYDVTRSQRLDSGALAANGTNKVSYLQIPLNLHFKLYQGNKLSLYARVGGSVGFLRRASGSYLSVLDNSIVAFKPRKVVINTAYGLEMNYRWNEKWGLRTTLNMSPMHSNIYTQSTIERKYYTLGLRAGLTRQF